MKLGLFRTLYALLPGRIYLMEPLRRWGRLPMSWTRHLFVHGTMTIQSGAGRGFRMFKPQVLAGFQQFKVWKPSLLIEILDDSIAAYVEDFMKDLGYLYFNVDEERGLVPTQRLSKSATYNYVLVQADKVPLLQPWIVQA